MAEMGYFGNDRKAGQDLREIKKDRSQSESLQMEVQIGFYGRTVGVFLHKPRDLAERARGGICKRSSLLSLSICVELLQHR